MHHFPRTATCFLVAAGAAGLVACGDASRIPDSNVTGPNPTLPEPSKSLIPTVNIAPAIGWTDTAAPRPATGLKVNALARNLDHPRWVYVLPNGDVLVAESNAPPKPGGGGGIRAWVMEKVMKRAGARTPSADRITLLRDVDGDGVAEVRSALLDQASGLKSPFGMALVGSTLYVANADAVVRFPYTPGTTRIAERAERVTDLPAGINHHWTKNLIASRDGTKLYVTVGSNSNVGENGMGMEEGRAAVWEVDPSSGAKRLFATGLRNPNGLGWEPTSGVLWTVVNERDEIGSDLVPDYLTSVKDGAFYGWPYSYWGKNVDERVVPARPELVEKAVKPDYALGNHVAPLGMVFAGTRPAALQTAAPASAPAATSVPMPQVPQLQWPASFGSGAFVGQHGSWNRKPLSGYNVVFVPFANGMPSGAPVEVLGGFVNADGKAYGRPVGVTFDLSGALLVADDVGNIIWRVVPG
jgi:glucose/arabinose dehydrogenase